MDHKALEIRVRGRVQGVGFRYFTHAHAVANHIRGWVKNMPDGSVLLRVAGRAEDLDLFCRELGRGPAFSRVEGFEEKAIPALELREYRDFRITY